MGHFVTKVQYVYTFEINIKFCVLNNHKVQIVKKMFNP
jgi:hypothetical protein